MNIPRCVVTVAVLLVASGAFGQTIGGPAKQRNLGGPAVQANPVVPPVRGTAPSPVAVKPTSQARPTSPPVAATPVRAGLPTKKPRT